MGYQSTYMNMRHKENKKKKAYQYKAASLENKKTCSKFELYIVSLVLLRELLADCFAIHRKRNGNLKRFTAQIFQS